MWRHKPADSVLWYVVDTYDTEEEGDLRHFESEIMEKGLDIVQQMNANNNHIGTVF